MSEQLNALNNALDAWRNEMISRPKLTPEQEAERAAKIAEARRLRELIPKSLDYAREITPKNIEANAKKQAKRLLLQYDFVKEDKHKEFVDILTGVIASWWHMGGNYESDRRDGYL